MPIPAESIETTAADLRVRRSFFRDSIQGLGSEAVLLNGVDAHSCRQYDRLMTAIPAAGAPPPPTLLTGDPDVLRLRMALYTDAVGMYLDIMQGRRRFVHYTSATAGASA